jgi:hypothetical protein
MSGVWSPTRSDRVGPSSIIIDLTIRGEDNLVSGCSTCATISKISSICYDIHTISCIVDVPEHLSGIGERTRGALINVFKLRHANATPHNEGWYVVVAIPSKELTATIVFIMVIIILFIHARD